VIGRDAIFVEAAARLHFGVLDLRGSLGRWFGGLGAAASEPTLLVSAEPHDTLAVEGQDDARAAEFALRFLGRYRIEGGARIHVHRALPAHAGLGSGTQLALAVARALAELHGIVADVPTLARAVGRADRSAVGTWTFAGGGLVVEGGRGEQRDDCGPLVARLPFPQTWRSIVAVPVAEPSASGIAERDAFAQTPPPPEDEAARVSHLVLMALLPSVAEDDIDGFGRALNEIQDITGGWFAPVQGGRFAPGLTTELVHQLRTWGAPGVGQSSWGPAVYAVVRGDDAARRLADRVREMLSSAGAVYTGPFRQSGARVWTTPAPASRVTPSRSL
jgi:beta-ribofuranosylaminobenzene 5'-phosphate synthase